MASLQPKRMEILSFNDGDTVGDRYIIRSATSAKRPAKPIGKGGSGVVFLAEQTFSAGVTKKRVVKFFLFDDKVAQRESKANTGIVSRVNFGQEILNLAGLNHRNVVRVVDAGACARKGIRSVPFLIMDYVSGPTLANVLSKRELLRHLRGRPEAVVDMMLQLCEAVTYLHAERFYHCDIAPKNIFLELAGTQPSPVLGDLGTGHTLHKGTNISRKVFIIGTREYAPEEAVILFGRVVPISQLAKVQPLWDMHSLLLTLLRVVGCLGEELTDSGDKLQNFPWLLALERLLASSLSQRGINSADKLKARIELLNPSKQRLADIAELGDATPTLRWTLLPVEKVAYTKRVEAILDHPALLRLRRVPQITMASSVFPGATHTRFEHTFGTYQVMRRYLQALLKDERFLACFAPEHFEYAIVCALLSNITRFPFSSIIHEIRSENSYWMQSLARKPLLEHILDRRHSGNSLTLWETVSKGFPLVNRCMLANILSDNIVEIDNGTRLTHNLLNSTIDARALDYLRRDSHHIGLRLVEDFDISELLQHVCCVDGRLAVYEHGVSAVEQVILSRYWLFNRAYWNRPNRALIAMIRCVLMSLYDAQQVELEGAVSEAALRASEVEMLSLLQRHSHINKRGDIAELVDLLLEEKPVRYSVCFEANIVSDAGGAMICNVVDRWSQAERHRFEKKLNADFCKRFGQDANRIHLLVDMPTEHGKQKMGEDLDVVCPNGDRVAFSRYSGIGSGAQRAFREHLQRLRVFLHPSTHMRQLEMDDLQSWIKERFMTA